MAYAGKQSGNGFGTFANRPQPGQSGRTYYATDTAIAFYDNGLDWQPVLTSPVMTPVSQSSFTWDNQGGATATDFGSGIKLFAPTAGSSHSLRVMYVPTPSTPYTVTARFITNGGLVNGNDCTIGLLWGDGTKYQTWHTYMGTNAWYLTCSRFSNSNTYVSDDYSAPNLALNNHMQWYRISDDGTNRTMGISRDGVNFITCFSIPSNTYLTPNRVGFFLNAYNGDVNSTLVSWEIS